jgi:hypothetical protein
MTALVAEVARSIGGEFVGPCVCVFDVVVISRSESSGRDPAYLRLGQSRPWRIANREQCILKPRW